MKNPLTVVNDKNLLYAPFRGLIEEVVENANRQILRADGEPKFIGVSRIGIFESYRSPARQLSLYAQGRTKPGNIVTGSKVSNYHSVGLAADLVWYDEKGNPHWDNPVSAKNSDDKRTVWEIIGHAARVEGLVWGGDWRLKDLVHIQCSLTQRVLWLAKARKSLRDKDYATA